MAKILNDYGSTETIVILIFELLATTNGKLERRVFPRPSKEYI